MEREFGQQRHQAEGTRTTPSIAWLVAMLVATSACAGQPEPPLPLTEAPRGAREAELTSLVFEEDFANDKAIDFENTREPGYSFYVYRPFGWPATEADAVQVEDGILTIDNPVNKAQFDLCSAASAGNGQWVGFAHRGAAYFEAAIAFDPKDWDKPDRRGFPAFWTMSAEHLFDTLWVQTRAEYEYLEIDFMEFMARWHPSEAYASSIHAWINRPDEDGRRKNRSVGFPKRPGEKTDWQKLFIHPPDRPDFSKFHVFGVLWIPGERIDTYFNNQLMRSVRFKDWPHLNVGQDLHYPVILGSGNFPMRVDWVRVWAAP